MLSHLRRGHHHELHQGLKSTSTINSNVEQWKSTDPANSSFLSNNLLPDAYTPRSNAVTANPDLSHAFRFDAYLLAIVRIDDKKSALYSAEVVSKLRQKEQTKSFINKPCSLFVNDRQLIIFDRVAQVIAETIPLENVDPTCVHSDAPDTLNDIFMYRLLDRAIPTTASQSSSTHSSDSSSVIVFKCSNNEAKALVDSIRNATGKSYRNMRSGNIETHGPLEPPILNTYLGSVTGNIQSKSMAPTQIQNPPYTMNYSQAPSAVISQTELAATDYYKNLTEELNKCFDDIELFVRYLEALMEYTKELERDHRRKVKKSAVGLKQMIEKLPEDRYFVDILQKFKHSFNLLGELKHIIHNPNAPELVHYLLSPLQFILYTLRTKHPNQLQIAQDIKTPAFTKDAKELLLNCLTSKEHDILRNLGPTWVRTLEDNTAKFSDYRPVFFEGHAVWFQNSSSTHVQPTTSQQVQMSEQTRVTHPFTKFDEGQQYISNSVRQSNPNNQNNGLIESQNAVMMQQSAPNARHFDTSTIDRSVKNGIPDTQGNQIRSEHAWAVDRKQNGAKICAVKSDRKGKNHKELSVRRGELIEIEDSTKKWWRARNYYGEVGHVPHNIVEEVEIIYRPH